MTYDNDMAMSKPIPNSSSNHLSYEQIHKIARYVQLTEALGEAPVLRLEVNLGGEAYKHGPHSGQVALIRAIRALADFIAESEYEGPDFMSFIDDYCGPQFIYDESGITEDPIAAWTFDFANVPLNKINRAYPELIIDGERYSADYAKE